VWSTDHLVASAPILDSTVVLATAAAVTDRITIGFGVMLLALRPVAWAAKQIATLQQVSGNRVVLGVGTGNPDGDIGWRAAGVPFQDRGRRTDEALRVLPALVTGQPAVLGDGLEVTLTPGSPMPPVLVAASLGVLGELAAQRGRPAPRATVVGPTLDTDLGKAAAQLSAYEAVGTERVILAPSTVGWQCDYEFAGELRAAL
jgi:alkanesulfonate monooxygenase SsuD/methylene tetrahydromethanopterin reductase-like flavin-dependent oxidoreductase (luciferase family)